MKASCVRIDESMRGTGVRVQRDELCTCGQRGKRAMAHVGEPQLQRPRALARVQPLREQIEVLAKSRLEVCGSMVGRKMRAVPQRFLHEPVQPTQEPSDGKD